MFKNVKTAGTATEITNAWAAMFSEIN